MHQQASGPERKAYKAGVIGLLYRYRYERDTARKLQRFIDRLICLPPLELALRQELAELEEQSKMSYVTRWERLARQEAEARTLRRQMQLRCGPLALYLAPPGFRPPNRPNWESGWTGSLPPPTRARSSPPTEPYSDRQRPEVAV